MSPESDGRQRAQLDLAERIRDVEAQLSAWQMLLDEELNQLRSAVADCRDRLVALASAEDDRYLDEPP